MTLDEALQYFNSYYHLCKTLRIAPTNGYKWKRDGFIPVKNQFLINQLIESPLPIDMNKDEMKLRLEGGFKRIPIND